MHHLSCCARQASSQIVSHIDVDASSIVILLDSLALALADVCQVYSSDDVLRGLMLACSMKSFLRCRQLQVQPKAKAVSVPRSPLQLFCCSNDILAFPYCCRESCPRLPTYTPWESYCMKCAVSNGRGLDSALMIYMRQWLFASPRQHCPLSCLRVSRWAGQLASVLCSYCPSSGWSSSFCRPGNRQFTLEGSE